LECSSRINFQQRKVLSFFPSFVDFWKDGSFKFYVFIELYWITEMGGQYNPVAMPSNAHPSPKGLGNNRIFNAFIQKPFSFCLADYKLNFTKLSL
jgi:hypothetical protein